MIFTRICNEPVGRDNGWRGEHSATVNTLQSRSIKFLPAAMQSRQHVKTFYAIVPMA